MAHLKARTNDYARALGLRAFDAIPKAVLAAIAVSFASGGGDDLPAALGRIAHEWDMLHVNGIVPQAPPAWLRAEVPANEGLGS